MTYTAEGAQAPGFPNRVTFAPGQALAIEFDSVFGKNYQLQYSSNLQDWTTYSQTYAGTGSPIWIPLDLVLPPGDYFCRAVADPM